MNGEVVDNSPTNEQGEVKLQDIEYMRNVVFLSKEFGFTYQEIMDMPYAIFLSYIRWGRQFKLEENPEFLEHLEKSKFIQETQPDLTRLRNLKI